MTDEQYAALMLKLDDLHGDFREYKGKSETEIINIKNDMKDQKLWSNIKVIGVMPIMGLLHHYFGGK